MTTLYKSLIEQMGRRATKKLMTATYARMEEQMVIVRYHDTDILYFHKDETIVFHTGGWKTSTTKLRFNTLTPLNIWQEKGTWYFKTPSQGTMFFKDGMILKPDGTVYKHGGLKGQAKVESKLVKEIQKFCKDYIHALSHGEVSKPGLGDCILCRMPNMMGQMGLEHLRSHMEERYFVPSLLVNAMKAFPNHLSPIARHYIEQLWTDADWTKFRPVTISLVSVQLKKALQKYLFKAFNLPF